MADDRIVPVTEIERAVGAEFHVHRPETAARGFDQRRHILEAKPRAVVMDSERPHGIVDITTENERPLPFVRKLGRADKISTTGFASLSSLPDERGRVVSAMENDARHGANRRTVGACQLN